MIEMMPLSHQGLVLSGVSLDQGYVLSWTQRADETLFFLLAGAASSQCCDFYSILYISSFTAAVSSPPLPVPLTSQPLFFSLSHFSKIHLFYPLLIGLERRRSGREMGRVIKK